MSTLRIVEIVSGEWGTEFLEHRDKLAACQCFTHMRLERQDLPGVGNEDLIKLIKWGCSRIREWSSRA
jgi:hypothetical protein